MSVLNLRLPRQFFFSSSLPHHFHTFPQQPLNPNQSFTRNSPFPGERQLGFVLLWAKIWMMGNWEVGDIHQNFIVSLIPPTSDPYQKELVEHHLRYILQQRLFPYTLLQVSAIQCLFPDHSMQIRLHRQGDKNQ